MALKDGKPLIAFSVQGGDSQDQNLLQFFLNMIEWDMNVQQARRWSRAISRVFGMQSSFGAHQAEPGKIQVSPLVSGVYPRRAGSDGLRNVELVDRTYNPTTAIWFDHEHGAMHGAASDYGDDYWDCLVAMIRLEDHWYLTE